MMTIAFTRPVRRLAESIDIAEKMGFRVIAAPSIDITPGDVEDFERSKEMLVSNSVDIGIVCSVTAAEECLEYWGDDFSRILNMTDIIPIGSSTADYLREHGVHTGDIPLEYSSSGLVRLLSDRVRGKNVVIIHSDNGSDVLEEGLSSNGANVTELIAYRLKKCDICPEIKEIISEGAAGNVDVLMFTSPMSAETFFDHVRSEGKDPKDVVCLSKIAAIGSPTAAKLKRMGFKVDIMPEESTFKCLLDTIKKTLQQKEEKK